MNGKLPQLGGCIKIIKFLTFMLYYLQIVTYQKIFFNQPTIIWKKFINEAESGKSETLKLLAWKWTKRTKWIFYPLCPYLLNYFSFSENLSFNKNIGPVIVFIRCYLQNYPSSFLIYLFLKILHDWNWDHVVNQFS